MKQVYTPNIQLPSYEKYFFIKFKKVENIKNFYIVKLKKKAIKLYEKSTLARITLC